MKYLALILLVALMTGCSSTRTKWTDPQMRTMIDSDSIDPSHYARIAQALVNTGKFTVVDRASGLRAIKREQDVVHRLQPERYMDKEKWSHWGKLYSVGSIVVPHVQCRMQNSFWRHDRAERVCQQSLMVVHANTGEIMLMVDGQNSAPVSYDMSWIVPDWDEVVDKLADKYPTDFEKRYPAEQLRLYQDISAEEARRQKREITAEPRISGSLSLPEVKVNDIPESKAEVSHE